MGYPEVTLGINLQWVALPLCVHLIGPARANRMVMLGNREDADALLKWGYLDEVVERYQLMDRAFEMAEEYAQQPSAARGSATVSSSLCVNVSETLRY